MRTVALAVSSLALGICLGLPAHGDPILNPGAILSVVTNPTSIVDTSGGTPSINVPTVISVTPSTGGGESGGSPGVSVGIGGGGGETIGGGGVSVSLPDYSVSNEVPHESPVASASVGATVEAGGEGPVSISGTAGAQLTVNGKAPLGQVLHLGAIGNAGIQSNGGSAVQGSDIAPFSAGNGSSRMRTLLGVLNDRDWLDLAEGNALCLSGFGAASISSWLKPADLQLLDDVVDHYSGDIATLQKMIANCRANRSVISRNDIKRVIGLDVRNGQPVLFML